MRFAFAAVAVSLALAAPAHATTLKRGDSAFWSGPAPASACGERCWLHRFEVAELAHRLRIAVDHATDGDAWTASVEGPGGITATFTPGLGLYSMEEVLDGRPGTWEVRVTAAEDVRDLRYQLRAKLENEPPAGGPDPLLPNLQALPPYEFTFSYPVTNGTTDGAPVGAPVPAGRTACHPEELVEEAAVRCLRMAFGVRNTGAGPMSLWLGDGDQLERVLWQRVHNADGSHADRVAGVGRFHKTHQHFHHDDAIGMTLWRVTDPVRGGLEAAGAEHLKGFAHRNELLREWTVFYPLHENFEIGLRPGWGDYYEWDRPGNYIDLGTNPDGRYVLRIVADPVAGVLESNEADNAAYSMIDVAGESVTLIESGRGTDPWDRCKIVVPFGAEPDLPATAQPLRPADCPADSSGLPGAVPPQTPAKPAAARQGRCAKLGKRRRGESRRRYAKRRAAVRRCRKAPARRSA